MTSTVRGQGAHGIGGAGFSRSRVAPLEWPAFTRVVGEFAQLRQNDRWIGTSFGTQHGAKIHRVDQSHTANSPALTLLEEVFLFHIDRHARRGNPFTGRVQ